MVVDELLKQGNKEGGNDTEAWGKSTWKDMIANYMWGVWLEQMHKQVHWLTIKKSISVFPQM